MSTVIRRAGAAVDHAVLTEVVAGLRRKPKQLPCKLFYDDAGAALFERICTLDEYYPTRTEIGILRAFGDEMAAWIGGRARIVEYGSGSGEKTRLLLRRLRSVAEYVPIDISGRQLEAFAEALRRELPGVAVHPVHADYTRPLVLPPNRDAARSVVFFPGSTIGNFHPAEALEFLRNAASLCGAGGGLLIGVDLRKDRGMLERAYNDAAGVTAAFNLNALTHINHICDADFDENGFEHRAIYNEVHGRIEMHLVSRARQRVRLNKTAPRPDEVTFERGEVIVTEYSYKYTIEQFRELARCAGFEPAALWQDAGGLFSVHALNAAASS